MQMIRYKIKLTLENNVDKITPIEVVFFIDMMPSSYETIRKKAFETCPRDFPSEYNLVRSFEIVSEEFI